MARRIRQCGSTKWSVRNRACGSFSENGERGSKERIPTRTHSPFENVYLIVACQAYLYTWRMVAALTLSNDFVGLSFSESVRFREIACGSDTPDTDTSLPQVALSPFYLLFFSSVFIVRIGTWFLLLISTQFFRYRSPTLNAERGWRRLIAL